MDADQLATVDHRHVPELAFVHEVKRVSERAVGRDGARVGKR